MNASTYTEQVTIKAYECDAFGNLLLGAALRLVQQVGSNQCNEVGLTAAEYARTHTGFVLAKTALEFYAPIGEGVRITLVTQPSAAQRAVFYRYTELRSEDGRLLAAADTRWVLIDTQTKRILRHMPQDMIMSFTQPKVPALSLNLQAAPLTHTSTVHATYTRCDQYRHLNNTCYADILCDALPVEAFDGAAVKRFAISYHREVPMGQSFVMQHGLTQSGSYYFIGEGESGKHFEAELTLG